MLTPFPPKPQGMHWHTYMRLWRAAAAAMNDAETGAWLTQHDVWFARRYADLPRDREPAWVPQLLPLTRRALVARGSTIG